MSYFLHSFRNLPHGRLQEFRDWDAAVAQGDGAFMTYISLSRSGKTAQGRVGNK